MIEIKKLKYIYPTGTEALKTVDLTINDGERVGIAGQNGAGKTTLIKHFNGLLKPTEGSVLVDGIDTKTKSIAEMSKLVGYVFQNPEDQIFNSTIVDEVEFGLKQHKIPEDERKRRVKKVLEAVELWSKRMVHPANLNYSEKKLLTIASVLAMDPKIIIFDEPVTGQDYKGRTAVEKIVNSLRGKTLIFVSHDMEFIAKSTERVVVMKEGKIIDDGPSIKVFQNKKVLSSAHIEQPEAMKISEALGIAPCLTIEECAKKFGAGRA